MIRPRPARWFEALVARDDATLALEALASTGAIELEARPSAGLPAALADVRPQLAQFAELAQRYRAYWPTHGLAPSAFPEPPPLLMQRALARIRAWADASEPAIAELQAIDAEQALLARWQVVLEALGEAPFPFDRLAGVDDVRVARLLVFPPGRLPDAPPRTLLRPLDVPGASQALVVGPAAEVDGLARDAIAGKGMSLAIPEWLGTDAAESLRRAAARRPLLEARAAELRADIARLAERHGLGNALGDARRLAWVIDNVRALESGEHFCFVTGWTSDPDASRLDAALEASGARALLHFPPAPKGLKAPLLFANPWWARPFEVFARALGMPARDEIDPSALLALVVPLMFGYMFGDVGQGLVIATAGFLLRRRYAIARLFVAGGLAAVAFGFLFGSVFSLHAIPALWTTPLARPLEVLLVPIGFGALFLAVGLALAGVEAWWRDSLAHWLATEAPLLLVYLGLLAGLAHRGGYALAALGAIAFCAGHGVVERRVGAALAAIAELVERTLQLAINTLSFARVGAFALAHAGLSSAIVALMDASESGVVRALVLVVGNAIVIVLETLVVSIQTTRLVLFEFFTRFLAAGGRAFRPLPLPPAVT
jgi:V/A-type H+-transporting ATPase subunit I